MKIRHIKRKIALLSVLLILLSLGIIHVIGKEYTISIETYHYNEAQDRVGFTDPSQISAAFEQGNKYVEITGKKLENNILTLTMRGVQPGHDFCTVSDSSGSFYFSFSIYVHPSLVLSRDGYIGQINGDVSLLISFLIIFTLIFAALIGKYQNSMKNNMYQYNNVVYLGMIIFTAGMLLHMLMSLFNYSGIRSTLSTLISTSNTLSYILLPLVSIVSVIVSVSNVVLMIKEGFTWRNMLGMLLGLMICISTVLPDLLYTNVLFTADWIDVHREDSISARVLDFFNTFVYSYTTYLECVLIGTVVLAIKAARHIPAFDKDHIIILGCMIRKDGSLTNLLKSRVDRAIEFRNLQLKETGKDLVFVPSGGQGEDEVISEGQAMKQYLLSQGIDEEHILPEMQSKNTYENIRFSARLIREQNPSAKIAFSTTNYHVFRAGELASRLGVHAEGIGAKTKAYFWINAFIREFIATLSNEKKKHLLMFFALLAASAGLIVLYQLSLVLGMG